MKKLVLMLMFLCLPLRPSAPLLYGAATAAYVAFGALRTNWVWSSNDPSKKDFKRYMNYGLVLGAAAGVSIMPFAASPGVYYTTGKALLCLGGACLGQTLLGAMCFGVRCMGGMIPMVGSEKEKEALDSFFLPCRMVGHALTLAALVGTTMFIRDGLGAMT